jgi:hypothetical protein
MQRAIRLALLATSAAVLASAGPAAWSYTCYPGGGANCACRGEQDCSDMRHSNVCQVTIQCSGSGGGMYCTCTQARVEPGNGSPGDASGIKRAPDEAPPPTSAKPP